MIKAPALVSCLLLLACPAQAQNFTSVYTQVDFKKCRHLQKADGFSFGGSWVCPGVGGFDVVVADADARDIISFDSKNPKNCAGLKTFSGFNTSGKTIEWRLLHGKPIAAIQRWTVSIDPDKAEKTATWLVVTKLGAKDSCHMHYVAGAFPKANEAARNAADTKSAAFNCEKDAPRFDPADKAPPIVMEPCSVLRAN